MSIYDLELYRGDTWSEYIQRLGDITTATEIWFTAKRDKDDLDAAADILISQTVGLEYIDQAAAAIPANGSITVNDATKGNITVWLAPVDQGSLRGQRVMAGSLLSCMKDMGF